MRKMGRRVGSHLLLISNKKNKVNRERVRLQKRSLI